MSFQPVLECTRADLVESTHDGIITVATADGSLIASCGAPEAIVYMRSSAKPFQAVPIIESGALDAYAITAEELAVICSSHSGTDEHVRVLEGLQMRLGISEADLLTGVHRPFDWKTAQRLSLEGRPPTPNRHNCSGKHTGMLALAKRNQWPFEEYTVPEHPVQQMSRAAVAECCGLALEDVMLGVDGCSVPTFALPMKAAAQGYARMMEASWGGAARRHALNVIRAAMTGHPFLVAGPERFDTALMEATGGRLLAKGGAEGYQAVGIPAGNLGSGLPAVGLTLKIRDGDRGKRAVPAVTMAVLTALNALTDEEQDALAEFAPRILTNHAGLKVGEIRACFQLQWGL